MAANPYSINVAQPNLNPVWSGIGMLAKASREKADKQRVNTEFKDLLDSGDMDKLYEFTVNNPTYADAANNAIKFKNEGTRKNLVQTMMNLDRDPNNFADYLSQRNDYLDTQGADNVDTQELLTQFAEDPEQALADVRKVLPMMMNKQEWEVYKKMQNGETDPEFLKEERKTASQDVRSFNNQAKEMRTNYAKLQGLAEQAKTGDRGARNAMTVAVGRLMSPGIFTETEASALSGGQNSLQAVLGALAGKGVDTEALQRYIDPYGESFNTDGLLNIGSSIVASSRKPLLDMFEGSKRRAERAKMSKRAFDTNFGENPNYDFLMGFGADKQQESKPLPPINASGWKLMKDANGNMAYVSPDGQIEEVK